MSKITIKNISGSMINNVEHAVEVEIDILNGGYIFGRDKFGAYYTYSSSQFEVVCNDINELPKRLVSLRDLLGQDVKGIEFK